MHEALSQNEIDALMQGFTGDEPSPAVDEAETGGTRPYDLASQERIVRGRMPTLDVVMERFARNVRIGLFNLLRKTPEVSVGATQLKKYSAFLREIVVPTNFNFVGVRPLRGSGLVICEPTLVFAVVEAMFGGSGKYHTRIEGREFSLTEQRIIARLVGVITAEYNKAWAGIYPVELEYQRSEMQPQFATIATPSEVVVCSTVGIEVGESSGSLHICIPYATLEPIRHVLNSTLQGDTFETDRRWVDLLGSQIQSASVELVAELGHADATVKSLGELKVGDVLELSMGSTVEAKVSGVPLFECRYGTSNGHYALKIQASLAQPGVGWLGRPAS